MKNQSTITIKNNLKELRRVNDVIDDWGRTANFSQSSLYNVQLALEEILTNIISYAYNDQKIHEILIRFDMTREILSIIIEDDGMEFDPTVVTEPNLDSDLENRKIGGLGLHLVKKIMRRMEYKRVVNKNILILETEI